MQRAATKIVPNLIDFMCKENLKKVVAAILEGKKREIM